MKGKRTLHNRISGLLLWPLLVLAWLLWLPSANALPGAKHFEVTGGPASITAGVPFDLTVTAKNGDSTTDTGYTGTVYFSSTAAVATLPAPYTFVAGDNGTKTFSVTLGTAGSQTVSVSDDSNPGIAGWWKLDEGTGTATADSSGLGQTGTITGAAWSATVPDPLVAMADPASLSFSGTNNMVDIPTSATLQTATTFTAATWIKASTDVSAFRVFLSAEDATHGYSVYLLPSTGLLQVQLHTDSGGPYPVALDSGPLNDSQWHHVAVVIDNTAKTGTLYVDGVQRGNGSFPGNFMPFAGNLKVGQFANVGAYPFLGNIDDLRIYNRALSAAEIAALAAGSQGVGLLSTSAGITVNAGPPAVITPQAGTPQGAQPSATFATPLQAKVTDLGGNPIASIAVTFTAPATGASGTFAGGLATASVATGADGIATAPAFTANGLFGSYTVTAAGDGIAAPALFSLTNYLAPAITVQPQPTTCIAGQVPVISVTVGANGTPPISYQWYQGASGDTSSPVAGAVSASFDKPLTVTTSLWVQVTKYATVLNSDAALVTVVQPPAITVQPQHALLQNSQSTTLTVTATGDGTLSYQWYMGTSGDTSAPIAGATAASYNTPPFTTPGYYWVRVSSEYGHADSNAARIAGTAYGPFDYIPNFAGSSVSIIEPASNLAVATIPTPPYPAGVAASPDRSRIYISHGLSSQVTVINAADNAIVATVTLAGARDARGIGISPDGSRLYVANMGSNNVSVIDTVINAVIATIPVGVIPFGIAIHPDGSHVYVTNTGTTTVSVIDTASYTVSATIAVGTQPIGLAMLSDGSRLYVTNVGSNTVSVVDTASNTVSATVATGAGPVGATLNPDGTRLYVTNNVANSVTVVDTADNSVTATVTGSLSAPFGGAVSPDGSRLYVANYGGNTVTVIDTATNTVTPPAIAVEGEPVSVGRNIPWDTSPDPISFAPRGGVTPGATITATPVTVTGIDVPTYIGVTGGEYAVNGGSFTTNPGLVRSGDAVTVRLAAPAAYNSGATATLTVGARSAVFTVTTMPEPGGVSTAGVTLSAGGLVFSDRPVATTSPQQSVILTNRGAASLVIGTIALTGANPGDFALGGGSCANGMTIAVGGSCTIGTTFTPTDQGGRNAAISITSSAPGSPNTVTLYGGGLTILSDTSFANASAITINDYAAASPYPSTITVSGFSGTVGKVRVTLTGVSHTFPADIGVLLVGPQGQSVVLMNSAGSGTGITNANLTFDDAAAGSLTSGAIASGTYKPTDLDTGRVFLAPAPARPYGANLAGFAGTDPNGDWKLYVQGFFSGDAGSISDGWQLSISPLPLDTSPDPFAFAPKSTATPATPVESDPATIAGINTAASVAIAGGEYAVSTDGSTWGAWGSAPGTINTGNQVKVRVTSGGTPGAVTSAALTIGGYSTTFSVTVADNIPPVVDSFAMPATSGTLIVPVTAFTAHDNVAVTGWMITADSGVAPAAGDPGWRTIRPPDFTFAGDGLHTARAWVKDGAGNVSTAATCTVTVTTTPVIALSALHDGATTTKPIANLTGLATDPNGIATFTVTINGGTPFAVPAAGFNTALRLAAGANTITLAATDTNGHDTTVTRHVTYDLAAPALAVLSPPDGSAVNLTNHPSLVVEGTYDPAAATAVQVTVNGGAPTDAFTAGGGFMLPVTLVEGMNTIEVTAVGAIAGSSVKRTVFASYDSLTLAVADPAEDSLVAPTGYLLGGSVSDATAPITITLVADGVTYHPGVTAGSFEQQLPLPTEKSYPITIIAVDAWGRSATVTRTIIRERLDQTITFALASPVTYGNSPIALSATSSCGLPVTFGSSNTAVASVSGSTLTIVGAGSATITAVNQDGSTLCKPASLPQQLQVDKASLSVTADSKTRALGAANPVFTATYSGFVNGQTTAALGGAATFSTTATVSSPAGTYPITVSQGTLISANYTFTFVGGTLTIGSQYGLDLTIAGTGDGTVLYTEKGIACNSGCSIMINPGAQVILEPNPDEYSLFAGWSGVCTNTSGNCSFTMNGSKTATATFNFDSAHAVRVDGPPVANYSTILGAYANAATLNNAIIKIWGVNFTENFVFDQGKAVTLSGGYDGAYTYNTGNTTTLQGPVTLKTGTIIMDNLTIR